MINASNSDECVVDGALHLTFRLARFAGMAPLRFVPYQNGYKISVSYYNSFYGYILITLLNIIACVTIYLNFKTQMPIDWEYIFFCLCIFIAIALSSRGSYYGVRRMKLMITHLKTLDEIKTNVRGDNKLEKSRNKIKCGIIIFHFIFIAILPVVRFLINLQETAITSSTCISFLAVYVQFVIVFVLETQIVLMFLEIQSYLVVVKNKVDDMITFNTIDHHPSTTICNNLRLLIRAYITACDIVSKVNAEDGVIVLLIISYLITTIVNIVCYLVSLASSSPIQYADRILVIIWSIMSGVDFLAFIESFNLIDNEITNIKVKLIKFMYKITDVGHRVPIQLHLMYIQLHLNRMKFCPLSMFKLERSLTMSIFSAIITYFLFIIQLN